MGKGGDLLYRMTHGGRHRDLHEHAVRDPRNVIEVDHLTKKFLPFFIHIPPDIHAPQEGAAQLIRILLSKTQ